MSPYLTIDRNIRFTLVAAAFVSGAISGPALADANLRVVASIKPVHSLVSAVMAGVGEPHLLLRGKTSPHTFTMRPSDAAAITDANIVFLIDEAMETALAGAIESLATKARVIALADVEGLVRKPLRKGGAFEADPHHDHDKEDAKKEAAGHRHDHDHGHGAFDMHLWLDPVNAWTMARAIADTLSRADPANAAKYKSNARTLLPRLDELNEQISAQIVPARGKPFIVFHDGYRYFEDRFGLKAVGSAVVSAERFPGVKRIRQLRAKVRKLGVVCVFDEPQFDKRMVNVILEGTQARSGTVDPLGAAIEDGPGLYFTLLRNMAASFTSCLAPAG